MRRVMTILAAVAFAAAAILSGCSDANVPAGAPHALGKALLTKNSSDFHGSSQTLLSLDCSKCHDTEKKCSQCHFGADPSTMYAPPGVTGWSHGRHPHDAPELTAQRAVCDKCHSITRTGRNAPTTCHECHLKPPEVSHSLAPRWMLDHGPAFRGGAQECDQCHQLSTKCSLCHFGTTGTWVPPASNWVHGTTPHLFRQNADVCNNCHDRLRELQQGPQPCHDCHAPHAVGKPWLDKKAPSFHGVAATAGLTSCAPCHGSDYKGGSSAVSCYACHFTPGGGRVPPGSSWQHGRSGHTVYSANQSVCNACHNVNRTYGNRPGSCHDCHGDGDDD